MATATRLVLDLRKNRAAKAVARQQLAAEAARLVRKSSFTHEDSARVRSIVDLVKIIGDGDLPEDAAEVNGRLDAAFRSYLRGGAIAEEFRDMVISADASGGFFAPAGFYAKVISAMKAIERLTDPDVITVAESPNGYKWAHPLSDDTTAAASKFDESTQDTEQDPTLGSLVFTKADTWRTPMVKLSIEFAQDSGIPVDEFLGVVFGIRLARGIGVANVAAMIAGATVGVTAAGSASNDGSGSNGTNTIGTDDLCNLMMSVDPSYVASSSCGWAMNWKTLAAIWKLKDKQGRPVIKPMVNEDGDYLLYGKRVFISPSMDDIATTKKPIAFGDFSYVVQRVVKNSLRVSILREEYISFGQIAYRCWQRANSGFAKPAAESPVKILQNA
jgi:HK97 family phage major capsid protein